MLLIAIVAVIYAYAITMEKLNAMDVQTAKMKKILMNKEDKAEWNYRYNERLGILNPNHDPDLDSESCRIATEEADTWLFGMQLHARPKARLD